MKFKLLFISDWSNCMAWVSSLVSIITHYAVPTLLFILYPLTITYLWRIINTSFSFSFFFGRFQAGVSPLLQHQFEQLARQKLGGSGDSGENKRRKLLVIGQDCVEPLQALRSAGHEVVSISCVVYPCLYGYFTSFYGNLLIKKTKKELKISFHSLMGVCTHKMPYRRSHSA